MARTVQEIYNSSVTLFVTKAAELGITVPDPATWSSTDLYARIFNVFAICAFFLESIFDSLRTEIDAEIKELKPLTNRWYANKAKDYQHGFDLVDGFDYYDNTNVAPEVIAAAKVVKYSAVNEQEDAFGNTFLRIKLATESGADLAPLSSEQLDGVKEYFKRIKGAGVKLKIDSLPPDSLKMTWDIRYDPLILNSQGARLDGTSSAPVRDAVKQYLKNLPFAGIFVLQYVTDAVQAVEGVVIPTITNAEATYGENPFASIDVMYDPDAGYLRFYNDADLVLNFIPQSTIK